MVTASIGPWYQPAISPYLRRETSNRHTQAYKSCAKVLTHRTRCGSTATARPKAHELHHKVGVSAAVAATGTQTERARLKALTRSSRRSNGPKRRSSFTNWLMSTYRATHGTRISKRASAHAASKGEHLLHKTDANVARCTRTRVCQRAQQTVHSACVTHDVVDQLVHDIARPRPKQPSTASMSEPGTMNKGVVGGNDTRRGRLKHRGTWHSRVVFGERLRERVHLDHSRLRISKHVARSTTSARKHESRREETHLIEAGRPELQRFRVVGRQTHIRAAHRGGARCFSEHEGQTFTARAYPSRSLGLRPEITVRSESSLMRPAHHDL